MARARLAACAAAAALASGCAWGPKTHPARPREVLELESLTVAVPEGPGWWVERERDVGWRRIEAVHRGEGEAWDRHVLAGERVRTGPPATRDEAVAWIRSEALRLLGDPQGLVTELPAAPDPRFGPAAVAVLARAEESDASAGLLVKRVAYAALLQLAPPEAPDRLCVVQYEQAPRRGAAPDEAEQRWRALLDGVALRPVDAAAIRAAARPDFPKSFEPGLARRSLTLPEHGLQIAWRRERWIAPGDWHDQGALSYGITDRLEVSLPGYFRWALGEPEAILRPEVVLAAGWTRYERDATRGNVWGGAVGAAGRKRLGANVAARAGGVLEATHESETGKNALHGGGAAGVVWDPDALGRLLSLGLEVGYAARDVGLPRPHLAWLGGRDTPLVTVHPPFLDLGITGGVGWDGEELGALVGFSLTVTF